MVWHMAYACMYDIKMQVYLCEPQKASQDLWLLRTPKTIPLKQPHM